MRVPLAVLACLLPFGAHATKYTLADQNGVASCDVIDIATAHQLAYGKMHRDLCDPPAPTVSGTGVSTRLRGSSNIVWSFSVTGETSTRLYLLDLKALTWVEYYEDSGDPLQPVGSGILLKGSQESRASPTMR
jgi:hypothetical protein